MESRFQSGEGDFEHTLARRHYSLSILGDPEPLMAKLSDDWERDGVLIRFVAKHSANHTEALLRKAKREGQITSFVLERIEAL